MTLNTAVYITDQDDPHEVFAYCRGLLGAVDDKHPWYENEGVGCHSLRNQPGVGLNAWLWLYFKPGTPLRTTEDAAAHDTSICNLPDADWYDPGQGPCDGSGHEPAAWIEVHFDTAYGYTGPGGEGCGHLHVRLLAQLGQWLTERGVAWKWQNEFTGEVHDGPDRLHELAGDGDQAKTWFTTVALPAITASAREAG